MELRCSAGISHILIYPNGDVYRCMADYNAKQRPFFNAKHEWNLPKDPLLCIHEKCYAGCDIDWATKWLFKDDRKEPKIINAQIGHTAWSNQDIDKPLRDMIHIIWAPTLICNYSCVYCGCAVGKYNISQDFSSASPELSLDDWINIWSKIYDKYKFAFVTMAGGEPLLSKATLPVIKMISDKFTIGLTTNLSVNVMEIVRSGIKPSAKDSCEPGIQVITGSLHPTSKGFSREIFFGSMLYLKNNGFNVAVNFVGHPLQLFLAEEYKQWCDKYGIDFVLSPWCGRDNNGLVAKYTEAEEIFLNRLAPSRRKTETQTEFKDYKCVIEPEVNKLRIKQGQLFILNGIVKNLGSTQWINQNLNDREAYKVGGRIRKYGNEKKVLKELRAKLPYKTIMPGEICKFVMKVDIHGLPKGNYNLKLDIVKEDSFWFEDKGKDPYEVRIKII